MKEMSWDLPAETKNKNKSHSADVAGLHVQQIYILLKMKG
jgi:hypothetical protein